MSTENRAGEDTGQPQQGENKPSKAIDTPKEVEESQDQKIDEDFPGYPHYPAKEDIMNKESGMEKKEVDVEKLTRSQNTPDN
ncbi:MAG: hypothetical protein WKF91_02880 [Segetibacter sp.]|jgi:hypothetical protein